MNRSCCAWLVSSVIVPVWCKCSNLVAFMGSSIVESEFGSIATSWSGTLAVSRMASKLRVGSPTLRSFSLMYEASGEWWICALNMASYGLMFSFLRRQFACYFALRYLRASAAGMLIGLSRNSSCIFCWLTLPYMGERFSYFVTRSFIEKPSVTFTAPFFFFNSYVVLSPPR